MLKDFTISFQSYNAKSGQVGQVNRASSSVALAFRFEPRSISTNTTLHHEERSALTSDILEDRFWVNEKKKKNQLLTLS